jgi:predicted metal-dependent HD superfamily phosphohydrolase
MPELTQHNLTEELESFWERLVFSYTGDRPLINDCWNELLSHYSNPNRHYHNLKHVYTLIRLIESNKAHILNYHALLFAAFYHDVVYDVTLKNNEALSAELAYKRLRQLNVDDSIITLTVKIINQTASHLKTNNFDIDLFLDFDRRILSAGEEEYQEYAEGVRKEYGIFSDNIYRSVRSKFLQQYLSAPEIYYTAINKSKEKDAVKNLEKEYRDLQQG